MVEKYIAGAKSPDDKPHVVEAPKCPDWWAVVVYDAPAYDKADIKSGLGVLVGPRHVLTCAQRVDAQMDEYIVGQGSPMIQHKTFRVRVGGTSLVDGVHRNVQQIVSHPAFVPVHKARKKRKTVDLAILVLDEPVDVPRPPIGEPRSLRGNSRVSAFGFSPETASATTERATDLIQFNTIVFPKMVARSAKAAKTEMMIMNCPDTDAVGPGFLGAPLMSRPQGGTPEDAQLVGIVSRSMHGVLVIATDLTRHQKWIAATIAATTPS